MSVDKNSVMIQYLMGCPAIRDSPLFFNFAEEEDGNNHFVSVTNQENTTRRFVDGSEMKLYVFQLVSYHAITHNPIESSGAPDGNIEDMAKVREILDWIVEQDEAHSYPNFGNGYSVESMQPVDADPSLNAIDMSVDPPIAQYSIIIRITYLDTTKRIWSST